MKKLLPILAVLIIAGVVYYLQQSATDRTENPISATGPGSEQNRGQSADGTTPQLPVGDPANSIVRPDDTDDEDEDLFDDRPANEIYKSADEALKAIKTGAQDYDDLILEQFTELGENCNWCDAFYTSVKEMLQDPVTGSEEKSYYAEVLAISGRVDNVKSLIDQIKNAPNQETADILSEALELTLGKDDVVSYLGEQINSTEGPLQESVIAALTNQGSRLAADTLYRHTIEKGDPDGYYKVGIGLGEFVPNEDAIPYLHEQILKRDAYSHLAVKSALNGGLEGLKVVMNSLENSPNQDADRKMLEDAVDHVAYDEGTKEYLEKLVANSSNPVQLEFAKQILESLREEFADEAEEAPALPPQS